MKNQAPHSTPRLLVLLTLLSTALAVLAQTPVDEDGKPLGPVYAESEALPGVDNESTVYPADEAATVDIDELLSADELAALVGPIALYPDDLLAVVLPASTYPLQVVQAARYLEQRKSDSSLQPDDEWDDSVVALLNYPEVLEMMSDDIDWTWRLGEAVVAQQGDVVAAVEVFRDRAYAAGNLKSDERQKVSRNDDEVIVIEPVEEDVIYVPYYEPERVVVYQTEPVYHYYPRAYPVYYYPYPVGYHFGYDYFWGVTTAFRIGWYSNHLQVFHHSYYGHPYYGRSYYGNYWRRPSIQIFNTWYGGHGYASNYDRYRYGSYWRPRRHGGARPGVHPARDRYYSDRRRSRSDDGYADRNRDTDRRDYRRDDRQYNGQVGRRAALNNDTPRTTRRSTTDNSANRDVPARASRGENADSRRGTTPRLRNRETATDQRDIARAAQNRSGRSGSAQRTNERDEIRFRDRSRTVDRTATGQRARTADSAPVTARNNVRSRPGLSTDNAPARARSAGTDTRDRMRTNVRDNGRSGTAADARRAPQTRVVDRSEPVRQVQSPRARTNPATPRTATAPARSANRDAVRSTAPQRRQARQSVTPSRPASAPAARSARRESAAPQRSAASSPAPQRRSAERRASATDSSRARSGRGGDRRRDRD